MPGQKTENLNPDSVTLEDVIKMNSREWKIYTFMKLNKLDGCVGKIENRLWYVITAVVVFGVIGIFVALVG